MSSSVATRVFLTQLPSLEAREPYLPTLLPPLCLNRYTHTYCTCTQIPYMCTVLLWWCMGYCMCVCMCVCVCVVVLYRHYVAEGVRLYSQETWKLVTEMKGIHLVEKYITIVG